MTDELFKLLESKGIKNGHDAFQVIEHYDVFQMMTLAAECFMSIKDVGKIPESKLFNFAPIASIAGGERPCSNVQCRIESAYSFSLLASLYAEKVILPNFFDYMFYYLQEDKDPPATEKEIDEFQYRLCADIAVCFQYKPLFDAEIAVMNFTVPSVCQNCRAKHIKQSDDFKAKLEKALNSTQSKFDSKVRFVLVEDDYIKVENNDDYLGGEHGYSIRHTLKAAMRKRASKIPYTLNDNEVSRFGLKDIEVDVCVDDILEYDFYPSLNSSTYLTNRHFDLDLIEASKGSLEDVGHSNFFPAFHELPFLQDILIEDLIKLRKSEESSFKVYRDSVSKIVDSKDNDKASGYMEKELLPALNNINNVISQNQKHYRARAGKKIVTRSVLAIAGIGAANLLNLPIQTSLTALGTAGIFSAQDIADDLNSGKELPIDAKVDPYYFMWAIKQQHDVDH